jgi:hypothetical protein
MALLAQASVANSLPGGQKSPESGEQPLVTYLDRPDLRQRVDSCLQYTYNCLFSAARKYQKELLKETPYHPAPYFLNALIIYWENFPLTPEHDRSDQFIRMMDRSVDLAKPYLESDNTYLEGVFFDLFGRAFKAMYWADNGKAARVIPDLATMYRYTMEGFRLKDELSEFYFSTGLYNYYIEAYPEAHPIYKPLVSFMKKGNKELGLCQLDTAIHLSVYLRVESVLFMSLIQLNYEEDLQTAAIYAERLYRDYPRNTYYQGHFITVLLHQHRFQKVREVLENMDPWQNRYAALVYEAATAFIAEMETNNLGLARRKYFRVIELADSIGPFANTFQAIAYMGLSRIYAQRGLNSDAGRYARKASNYTAYKVILNEK